MSIRLTKIDTSFIGVSWASAEQKKNEKEAEVLELLHQVVESKRQLRIPPRRNLPVQFEHGLDRSSLAALNRNRDRMSALQRYDLSANTKAVPQSQIDCKV